MPILVDQNRSVAANARVAGIFAGQLHEYVPYACMVACYVRAAAVGIFATLNLGGEIVASDQAVVSVKTTTPVRPDDLLIAHPIAARGRIVYDLRNNTAGAIVTDTLIDLTPL